jgi:hypothetical protein
MIEILLAWDPPPAEELVTEVEVFMDGTSLGKATGNEYPAQIAEPGVHSFQVQAIGPYGPGPISDPVSTPPITSKLSLRIGKITVSAQASASAVVEGA